MAGSDIRIEDAQQLSPDDPRAQIIDLLGNVYDVVEKLPIPINDGSRMADDRAATSDLLDLPQVCEHYLSGSEDFLLGLCQLMSPQPDTLQLPRFAPYPLIRGVIESSGQVVWVLSPDDRRERFRRLLQLQKDELDYDCKFVDALTRPRDDDTEEFRSFAASQQRDHAPKRRSRWRRLLDAGAAVGIGQAEFEHGVPGGYESLIREAADEQNLDRDFHGRQCASIWMFVSGLSHPSMWRAWAGSKHEPGEVGPDGDMPIRFAVNPEVLRGALHLAVQLHVRAILLMKQASAAPSPTADGS